MPKPAIRPKKDTRSAILEASRRVAAEKGFAALTFDAIAHHLGITKQAVIYWFPSKQDLIREITVPLIRAEAEVAIAALDEARDAPDAIARFVRAIIAHHTGDLTRFRQTYLAGQLDAKPHHLMPKETLEQHVHPMTSRMYGALERKFGADPAFRVGLPARRAAVVVHMAALGLVTMLSLADAVDDPLAHATGDLVDTLVSLLCRGAVGEIADPRDMVT